MCRIVTITRLVVLATALVLLAWLGAGYHQRLQAYESALNFWPVANQKMAELAQSNPNLKIRAINVEEKIAEEVQNLHSYRVSQARKAGLVVILGGILFWGARWIPLLEQKISQRIKNPKAKAKKF